MNKNGIVYTVVFSFVVTFFFVLLLSLANGATAERAAEQRTIASSRALLTALGIEFEPDEVLTIYESDLVYDETTGVYRYDRNGETLYAKAFAGSGLWGTIEFVLGVDSDVETIVGLEIVAHNETPGLGGRIDEAWYKEQFRGERLGANGAVALSTNPSGGDADKTNGRVDAVTGASRTSEAMRDLVNAALETYREILGGRS